VFFLNTLELAGVFHRNHVVTLNRCHFNYLANINELAAKPSIEISHVKDTKQRKTG
jgi:hypothetical protein